MCDRHTDRVGIFFHRIICLCPSRLIGYQQMLIGRIWVAVVEGIHSVQQFAVLLLRLLIGVVGWWRADWAVCISVCSADALLRCRLRVRLLLWRSFPVIRLLIHERRAFAGCEEQRVIGSIGAVELVEIAAVKHIAWTTKGLIHIQVEAAVVRWENEWVWLM